MIFNMGGIMRILLVVMLFLVAPLLSAQESVYNGSEYQTVHRYDKAAYRAAEGTHSQYGVLVVDGVLSKKSLAQLAGYGLTIEGVVKLSRSRSQYLVSSSNTLKSHTSELIRSLPGYYNLINYKRAAVALPKGKSIIKYRVSFFDSIKESQATQLLGRIHKGFEVIDASSFAISLSATQLNTLLQHEEVKAIEVFKENTPDNDIARERTFVDVAQLSVDFDAYFPPDNNWLAGEKYTGHHIDVGIYDSGIDRDHTDFREITLDDNGQTIPGSGANAYQGKLTNFREMDCENGGLPNKYCNYFHTYNSKYPNHGTHVAGIVGGNGWRSSSVRFRPYQMRGVAPKVNFWSDVLTARGVYEVGHVTNHSHSSSTFLSTDRALHLQNFRDNRRKTIVFSANNRGIEDGYYSTTKMKNPIIVGNANKYTGKLYAGSSMGPTNDGRIKPDIVAPGSGDYFPDPTVDSPVKVMVDSFSIKRPWLPEPSVHYDFNGSLQGWKGWKGIRNLNHTTESGSLYFEKIEGLSYIVGPDLSSTFIPFANDELTLRYKIVLHHSQPHFEKMDGILYGNTVDSQGKEHAYSLPLVLDVSGQYETLSVNISDLPIYGGSQWHMIGPIKSFRLDFNRNINTGILSTNRGGGYGDNTGTSMAAPHVTGIVALMLEKYAHKILACPLGEDCADLDALGPRNSLSKALLIHTAKDLENDRHDQYLYNPDLTAGENDGRQHATVYHKGPDFATGWGLVNANKALKAVDAKKISRTFVEDNETKVFHFRTGQTRRSFRVTATWDDIPAEAGNNHLINDVDMHLIAPDGRKFYPWVLKPFANGPIRVADVKPASNTCTGSSFNCYDHLNNVEVIDVDFSQHQHGDWRLVVKGHHIHGEQEVSLVSDYELKSDTPRCWQVNGWSSSALDGAQALLGAQTDCTRISNGRVYSRRFTDDNYFLFSLNDSRVNGNTLSTPLVFYGYDSNNRPIIKTKYSPQCNDCGTPETLQHYPPKQGEVAFGDYFRLRDPDTNLCLTGGTTSGTVIHSNYCDSVDTQLFELNDIGNLEFQIKTTMANQCLYAHQHSNALVKSWGCHDDSSFGWKQADQGLGYRLAYPRHNQCLKGGTSASRPAPHDQCRDSPLLQYQMDIVERRGWTTWLDLDNPGPGGSGDYETLSNHITYNNVCPAPVDIRCQTLSGQDWTQTRDVLSCTKEAGLVCRKDDQPHGDYCQDYRVRFYCPE